MSIIGKCFDRLESLEELREAIEMGMDIEFKLYEKRYNISWRNHKPFICVCPNGEAEFYEDTDELLKHHRIDGHILEEVWTDMEILAM